VPLPFSSATAAPGPAASPSTFQCPPRDGINGTRLTVNPLNRLSATRVDQMSHVNSWFLILPAFRYKATPRHPRVTWSRTHAKTQRSCLPQGAAPEAEEMLKAVSRRSWGVCSQSTLKWSWTKQSTWFWKLSGKDFSHFFPSSHQGMLNCFHWKRRKSSSC